MAQEHTPWKKALCSLLPLLFVAESEVLPGKHDSHEVLEARSGLEMQEKSTPSLQRLCGAAEHVHCGVFCFLWQ